MLNDKLLFLESEAGIDVGIKCDGCGSHKHIINKCPNFNLILNKKYSIQKHGHSIK